MTTLLSLLCQEFVIFHAASPEEEAQHLAGRDVDCAVRGVRRYWALRLPPEFRLCQSLHYDLRAWYWVVDTPEAVACLDTLDDPTGLGRDAVPVMSVLPSAGTLASPGLRAAYLVVKRIRKGDLDPSEWERIAALGALEPAALGSYLKSFLGKRDGRLVSARALRGMPPSRPMWRRLRARQIFRRVGSPVRLLTALTLGARREMERIRRPTGLHIVIVGPDGAGKSTLAAEVSDACSGIFRRQLHCHTRAGVLPRPGAVLGRPLRDVREPHAAEPHGRWMSTVLVGYHWLDTLLGELLRVRPTRMRTGLVVTERGWWDIQVDPRRYRLDAPRGLVSRLGRMLPAPDLTFVMGGPPEDIVNRKQELTVDETQAQMDRWRTALPGFLRQVRLDATTPRARLAAQARSAVIEVLEERAMARLDRGWIAIPPAAPRWWLPRDEKFAGVGLTVYQPVTRLARAGWDVAQATARTRAFNLLPRGDAPPRAVRELLAAYIPPGGTIAVARSQGDGRYVSLLIDADARPYLLAKIALSAQAATSLATEKAAIESLSHRLTPPLAAPVVAHATDQLLFMEAVDWAPRRQPWLLGPEIAHAIGRFSMPNNTDPSRRLAHGDFAPWNILDTRDASVLIDWESLVNDATPFHDLCHWLFQSHTLLGRPSTRELVSAVEGSLNWVSLAVRAYADGAELAATAFPVNFMTYLKRHQPQPDTLRRRDTGRLRDMLLEALSTHHDGTTRDA